ncbi:MAG: hypothetical protein R6U11_03145 [Bacteroidales bacterium]
MEILVETWLQLGFVGVIIIVFLYQYICNNREERKESKKTNETITEINTKIFNLFTEEMKFIAQDSHDNKKLNKDIMVILAQMQKLMQKHDDNSRESWTKVLRLLTEMCETMNGQNPAIKKLQDKIVVIQEKIDEKTQQ